MKICGACSQELPKDKFSKKQWQLKQKRRCKECIADNREVASVDTPALNDAAIPPGADGDGASDEDLFKQPPPRDECPICFLPRPIAQAESKYQSCCGKLICYGCIHAVIEADKRRLCPFCRDPMDISNEDFIEKMKKRVEANDSIAMRNLGCYHAHGMYGLRQNIRKAMKLWFRAGELGDAWAYNNIGVHYNQGRGVERDVNKAKYYYEFAAIGGCVYARYNLGIFEGNMGTMERAMKHYMISAGAGDDKSLKVIRDGFMDGNVTKDDFEKALRTHKEAADEMKSGQREAAKLVAYS